MQLYYACDVCLGGGKSRFPLLASCLTAGEEKAAGLGWICRLGWVFWLQTMF